MWRPRFARFRVVIRDRLATIRGITSVTDQPGEWVRFQPDQEGAAEEVLRVALDAGISSVRTGYPSLEEVYLRVMGDRGMEV